MSLRPSCTFFIPPAPLRRRAANFLAVAGLAASSLSGSSSARADFFDFGRPLDQGGRIASYVARIEASTASRHVISGDCLSACTLWLAHRNTCVTPDAVLWFHGAQAGWASGAMVNPWGAISASGNATLLRNYPPRVREAVRPWLSTPDFHTLTGRQLAALGVPLCPANAAE